MDASAIPREWWEGPVRLAAACACGALIGINRERHHRPAGLRTHMLVALGSAAFALAGMELSRQVSESGRPTDATLRIIQAVAIGVGFLGAGSISRRKGRMTGLTTSAGIWCVAAVGFACGAGMYVLAASTTTLAFLTLTAVRQVERLTGLGGKDHPAHPGGDEGGPPRSRPPRP